MVLNTEDTIFLPFGGLKLIVVSRRRRASFGRRSPTPHCRTEDTTVILTGVCKTGALLNATAPSVRDCCGTRRNGCNLMRLGAECGNVRLPRVRIMSMGSLHHHGVVDNPFSPRLLTTMERTLGGKRRTVLFRGHHNFTPVIRYGMYN